MDYNSHTKINFTKMKNIIASVFAVAVLASCGGESVEPAVEETMVDTTEVMVEDTVAVEEVVETEGEEAMAE
jgi:PBP1b-binding outer membrane lipoprotein LpoB